MLTFRALAPNAVIEESLRRCAIDHALKRGGCAPFFASAHGGSAHENGEALAAGAAVRFDARMPLIELYRVFHASHALRALAGDADDGFGFGLDAEPSLLVACLAHGVLLTVADVLVLERYVFNADLALRTRIARAADAAPAAEPAAAATSSELPSSDSPCPAQPRSDIPVPRNSHRQLSRGNG